MAERLLKTKDGFVMMPTKLYEEVIDHLRSHAFFSLDGESYNDDDVIDLLEKLGEW